MCIFSKIVFVSLSGVPSSLVNFCTKWIKAWKVNIPTQIHVWTMRVPYWSYLGTSTTEDAKINSLKIMFRGPDFHMNWCLIPTYVLFQDSIKPNLESYWTLNIMKVLCKFWTFQNKCSQINFMWNLYPE